MNVARGHEYKHTFCDSSSIIFSLSYSLRLLALYTWNSPEPAPALEPCTFFIISLAGLIAFSFGGAGINAGFAGSFRSRSNCTRCFSTAVSACRLTGGVEDEGVGEADMAVGREVMGAKRTRTAALRA